MNNRTHATSSKSSYTKNLFFLLLFTPIAIQCMEGEELPALGNSRIEEGHGVLSPERFKEYCRMRQLPLKKGPYCLVLGALACLGAGTAQIVVSTSRLATDHSAINIALAVTSSLWFCSVQAFMRAASSIVDRKREARDIEERVLKIPLLSQIREQNVGNVLTLLEYRHLLDPHLDTTLNSFDEQGCNPLLEAIRLYDRVKDPQARIIRALIAKGALLWRLEHHESISPRRLEEGPHAMPPHDQPINILIKDPYLYAKVLQLQWLEEQSDPVA